MENGEDLVTRIKDKNQPDYLVLFDRSEESQGARAFFETAKEDSEMPNFFNHLMRSGYNPPIFYVSGLEFSPQLYPNTVGDNISRAFYLLGLTNPQVHPCLPFTLVEPSIVTPGSFISPLNAAMILSCGSFRGENVLTQEQIDVFTELQTLIEEGILSATFMDPDKLAFVFNNEFGEVVKIDKVGPFVVF